MPAKFLLIMTQILLLSLVLYLKENHLFNDVTDTSGFADMTNSQFNSAQSTLVGVTICFIIFMAFEFLMQLLGISLQYSQMNLL